MKTIIFILLKLAEIIGAVVAYGLLCWLGKWLTEVMDTNKFHIFSPMNFVLAFLSIFLIVFTGFIIYLIVFIAIPNWLGLNWEWADRITKKIKRS